MKNDRIVRAYDSVNPTAVQKERILNEILAEARLDAPEGNQRRRVKPEMRGKRKSSGRRLLPLAACFAVLLAVGLFLRGHFLSSAQDAPPGPVPEKPTAVHSGYEMTAADHYAPVLEKYRRAVEESWTEEQCRIEGITPNMQYVSSKTGYALVDLDGDGREELIIAQEVSPEHDMVWDFYTTLEDGTPIQLWSDERSFDHCRVYRDNIICISHEEDQPGEHAFYVLEYGKLVLLESIEYEGDGIIHRNAEGDTRSISAQEAMELIFGYKHQKLNLTWLQDNSDYFWDTGVVKQYAMVLNKYKTALTEHWTEAQCDENDISRQIVFETTNGNDLGWCILDVDQNGTDELIISDGSRLFDLYTLQNGLPVPVLSGYPDSYALCADGTIEMNTLFSKGCSWSFYTLSGWELKLQNILVYRNEYEGTAATERYYYGPDGDNTQPISKDEAGKLIVSERMELNLTLFVEQKASDPTEDYRPILEKYQTALQEKWDHEICINNDISLMIANYRETPESICAFYLDLDEDGVAELMITDGMMILDLYTLKDHKPVHLLTGWERNSYRYCMDNVIFNHGSSSAYSSCYNYYRMENGALILVDSVVFDASIDPDNPWFLSADGETAGDPITEEKANEIMEQYKDMTILGQPILQ